MDNFLKGAYRLGIDPAKVILCSLSIILVGYRADIQAVERVAVVAFELSDLTSLPNTPAELARTASIQPLLGMALSQETGVKIISINTKANRTANPGFGYLFQHPDEAAKLGQQFSAGWIIVGQHSKPSFLESSLIVEVVKVKPLKLVAELVVDLKGNHAKVTTKAVKALSKTIAAIILAKDRP